MDAWERQDGETDAAYSAFEAYLELGAGRTVHALTKAGTPSAERWSKRWHWRARARAWDAYKRSATDSAAEIVAGVDLTHEAERRSMAWEMMDAACAEIMARIRSGNASDALLARAYDMARAELPALQGAPAGGAALGAGYVELMARLGALEQAEA